MNERIEKLALQAGVYSGGMEWTIEESKTFICTHKAIERFANLVEAAARADEREECARKASIALLGVDKALTDRVLKAIRARGTT